MIITVLIAPDGSVAESCFGHRSGDLVPNRWLYTAAYLKGAVLAPGYRLEHHDLAELLARPTAADLQAAKDADHASTQEAFKLGTLISAAKVARLEAAQGVDRDLHEAAETVHDDLVKGHMPSALDLYKLGRALEAAVDADPTPTPQEPCELEGRQWGSEDGCDCGASHRADCCCPGVPRTPPVQP